MELRGQKHIRKERRVGNIFALILTASSLTLSAVAGETLKWAGDSEGGAPFVFQNPEDPTQIIGFEVDLAQAIAQELGKKPEFVQNQWDGLVPGLKSQNYDIAMNGIEITEDRKAEILFSDPYYLTYEQIVVRKETDGIKTLADLKGKKVGTLKFTLAHRMLEDTGGIEIRSYEAEVNAYEDLVNGRLDAVFLEDTINRYRGVVNPKLKLTGEPLGEVAYGIAIDKQNRELLSQVNRALKNLKENGKLKEILDQWNLWSPKMDPLVGNVGHQRKLSVSPMKYQAYLEAIGVKLSFNEQLKRYASFLPLLAQGALTTLQLSLLSMALAMVLGLVIALAQLYAPSPLRQLARVYVEVVRGTPLLIQLFFIFYGLPNVGIKLEPFWAAILGLGLNYAAYEAENYRAGILAVPFQQLEAAFALNMSRWQALRHIVIPQAMRLIVPPVTNDFISLLKDSSLVSVITMVELTKVYGQLAATYYDYFGIGLLAAGMYFLIGLPFVRLSRYLEQYFSQRGYSNRGVI